MVDHIPTSHLSLVYYCYLGSSPTHRWFLCFLIYWSFLSLSSRSRFRGGRYWWGDGIVWLVEFGRHPVWTPDRHGESKSTKTVLFCFFLSLLRRCCGMSVGVLAFNSLTLFMVVPGCVWFCARVCMCLSRWRLLFWCVRVCARCVLAAVSYSGSQGVPGVSVWLSPPAWAPSAGPWGQLSPGLFAGS